MLVTDTDSSHLGPRGGFFSLWTQYPTEAEEGVAAPAPQAQEQREACASWALWARVTHSPAGSCKGGGAPGCGRPVPS